MAPAKPPYDLGPRILRDALTEPFIVLREQQKAAARLPGQAEENVVATPGDERQLRRARSSAHLPTHRKLRVFTQDPATPTLKAAVTTIDVPYEPLAEGPVGSVVAVYDHNETTREDYLPVDLDDLPVVMTSGMKPSTTDPRFAQQMTYALATTTYHRFRRALGRDPQFSFEPHSEPAPGDRVGSRPVVKLHIHPHAFEEDNAYYDPTAGAIRFGYTRANRKSQRLNQPGALVFTSLSHDVVIHEMTHALLDGMRARFMLPTNPDVDGFHEGFADLVALFQRFSYRELVATGLAEGGGRVTSARLVELARQFGETTGDGETPLRTAFLTPGDLDAPVPAADQYAPGMEAHDMGAVLLRAVFDAFRTIFDEKTKSLRLLAADRPDSLPPALLDLLAAQAVRIADQFLNLAIRAVDYCPPVDVRLGEYLRALVTADFDLIPDDDWGYREALVRAFRRHGVRVEGVLDLSEDSLLWRGPERRLPRIPGLGREEAVVDPDEMSRALAAERPRTTAQQLQRYRARLIGAYVTQPEHLYYFGLAAPSRSKAIERPVVESVREVRRVSPDGAVNEDLVAEVIQRRKSRGRWFYGGATIVLSISGVIRYVVAKQVMSRRREAEFQDYLATAPNPYGACFADDPKALSARLRCLHENRGRGRRP